MYTWKFLPTIKQFIFSLHRSSSPPLRLQKRDFNNLPVVEEHQHNGHPGFNQQHPHPIQQQQQQQQHGYPEPRRGPSSPGHHIPPRPSPQGSYGQPPQGYQPGPPPPRPNSAAAAAGQQQRYPSHASAHGAYPSATAGQQVPLGPASNRSHGSQGSGDSSGGMRGRSAGGGGVGGGMPPHMQNQPQRPASTVPQSVQDSVPGGIPGELLRMSK